MPKKSDIIIDVFDLCSEKILLADRVDACARQARDLVENSGRRPLVAFMDQLLEHFAENVSCDRKAVVLKHIKMLAPVFQEDANPDDVLRLIYKNSQVEIQICEKLMEAVQSLFPDRRRIYEEAGEILDTSASLQKRIREELPRTYLRLAVDNREPR